MPSIFQIKDRIFYGWVVVVAIVAIGFVQGGVLRSFTLFFKSLQDAFDLTRAQTSAIFSVRGIFGAAVALLGGWAVDRYGPRIVYSIMGFFIGLSFILTGQTTAYWQLFITYSLLLAVGSGASYVVTTSTVLRWFNRKRGLALGITASGHGIGTALLAPLAAFLIGSFGWRNALMMLGGTACLVILSVSQLLKKDPSVIGALPDGTTPASQTPEVERGTVSSQKGLLLRMFRTTGFWYFIFIWLLMSLGGSLMGTHLVPHATDLGFSAIESATILSLAGIASIAGRLITGAITDKFSAKVVAIICSLLLAAAVLGLVWTDELWMLYLYGVVSGFTFAGFDLAMTVLISQTFGVGDIGKILGTLELGIFTGGIIGPLLGGLIFDAFNSYTLAFLIVAGVILARILLVILIRQETRRK